MMDTVRVEINPVATMGKYHTKLCEYFRRLPPEVLQKRFMCENVYSSYTDSYVKNALEKTTRNCGGYWFVLFDDSCGDIVGELHLPFINNSMAELAISINPAYQERGYAVELFSAALTAAKLNNRTVIIMNCLATNQKIQALAKRFGATVTNIDWHEREGKIVVSKELDCVDYQNVIKANWGFVVSTIMNTKSTYEAFNKARNEMIMRALGW